MGLIEACTLVSDLVGLAPMCQEWPLGSGAAPFLPEYQDWALGPSAAFFLPPCVGIGTWGPGLPLPGLVHWDWEPEPAPGAPYRSRSLAAEEQYYCSPLPNF